MCVYGMSIMYTSQPPLSLSGSNFFFSRVKPLSFIFLFDTVHSYFLYYFAAQAQKSQSRVACMAIRLAHLNQLRFIDAYSPCQLTPVRLANGHLSMLKKRHFLGSNKPGWSTQRRSNQRQGSGLREFMFSVESVGRLQHWVSLISSRRAPDSGRGKQLIMGSRVWQTPHTDPPLKI